MTLRHTIARTLLAAAIAALLAACGSEQADPHEAPREPKAYESVNAAQLSKPELIAHLATLSAAATEAAQTGQAGEFHHLEVAITPALEALEKTAADNAPALATIAELKDLAIKLHTAGHDGSVTLGGKIAAKIAELQAKLAGQLK